MYYEVRDTKGNIRMESLRKEEAVSHAQSIYRDEQVICGIDEIERTAITHPKSKVR